MESLTIHPQNKEQYKAIKAVLEALKIPFEKSEKGNTSSPVKTSFNKGPTENQRYNPEFVAKIRRSEKQVENGDVKVIGLEDLWK